MPNDHRGRSVHGGKVTDDDVRRQELRASAVANFNNDDARRLDAVANFNKAKKKTLPSMSTAVDNYRPTETMWDDLSDY